MEETCKRCSPHIPPVFQNVGKVITSGYYQHPHNPGTHGIRLIYEIAIMGVLRRSCDLYLKDDFFNNKIQSDMDNFLDNLIYEIAIIGVLVVASGRITF